MMSKSLMMIAIVDGEEVTVGRCHPGQARILRKQGLADFKKGKIVLRNPKPAQSDAAMRIITTKSMAEVRAEMIRDELAAMHPDSDITVEPSGRMYAPGYGRFNPFGNVNFDGKYKPTPQPQLDPLLKKMAATADTNVLSSLWDIPADTPDVVDLSPALERESILSAEDRDLLRNRARKEIDRRMNPVPQRATVGEEEAQDPQVVRHHPRRRVRVTAPRIPNPEMDRMYESIARELEPLFDALSKVASDTEE
jgi:hypothetical protein